MPFRQLLLTLKNPYLYPMKYPIGIQDFRKLREGGYLYVDKTQHIHDILVQGNYFFLSRPRRFGKSLLLSTINELYSGSRELFEGLWVERHWDWEASRRPVIWLKFSSYGYREKGLAAAIDDGLMLEARRLGFSLGDAGYKNHFQELITKAGASEKAILLIDEYDKPIIDFLDDIPQVEANRDILKSFYSVLKDCDPYLELAFITGVSAFSKVSIFLDLNNLKNLSLHRHADTLLGITQEELDHYFMPVLEEAAQYQKTTTEALYEQVKRWYNGYSWNGLDKVYNPFSLLSFLDGRQFRNFWFETGTPTFLVKEMKKQANYDIGYTAATANDLSNFDLRRLNPITVLFQTGYLTIQHYEPQDLLYTLDYPNLEVKHSLQEILLNEYLDYPPQSALPRVVNLRNALQNNDLDEAIRIINAAFAAIPYDHWQQENEHFFHAIIHLTFSLLGVYVQSEVHTAKGRCDALVQTDDYIYAFEFKLDKSAAEALRQIEEKGYLAPWADSPKEKIAVGVSFSSQEKQVEEWEVKHWGK
ncbi:MAG: ATP-binding protein [Phaeodactylibacter sp.]|nr:ATP-binding protein [Phaeodactylibacter sp.]